MIDLIEIQYNNESIHFKFCLEPGPKEKRNYEEYGEAIYHVKEDVIEEIKPCARDYWLESDYWKIVDYFKSFMENGKQILESSCVIWY